MVLDRFCVPFGRGIYVFLFIVILISIIIVIVIWKGPTQGGAQGLFTL